MSENNYPIMQQDNAKGATALQAQVINVYPNGITEEKCREICLSVYKDNIMSLQDEAKDIAYQRAEQLTDKFVEKLSKQNDEIRKKIEEQLKEPAMQEAIFKSQKCYALSNDEDHLTILTNMLIDRGHISQRTNKQMLIDDAIDIMPRLNQKHLDILAFYFYLEIYFMYGRVKHVDEYVNTLISIFNKILPLKKNDGHLQYLEQKKCLSLSFFSKDSFITHCIAKQSKMFSNGFDLTEIGDVFNSNLFVPSVFNENKYALIFNDEAGIIHLLGDKLPLIQLEKIQQLYNKKEVTPISDELLKKAIIDRYPDVSVLYEYEKVFTHYNLTLLGRFIGLTYLNTKIDKDIDWDFE